MAGFAKKFDSIKQDWTTPRILFDKLNQEFNFEWDLAASEENALCKNFYTKENDGLTKDWDGIAWLNCPYGDKNSKMVDWIKKAYYETQKNPNLTVVMLIPNRSNNQWWANYVMKAAEIRFIIGRPKFGDCTMGLPQPLCIPVFRQTNETTKYSPFYLKDC